MSVNDILKMDGRKKAPRIDAHTLLQSIHTPTVAGVKLVIAMFQKKGESSHSGMRILMPYVIAYCEENKISYQLQAGFKDGKCFGYFIKRMEF